MNPRTERTISSYRRFSAFALVMFGLFFVELSRAFWNALHESPILYWGAELSRTSLTIIYLGLLATAFRIYVDLWVAEDDLDFEQSLKKLSMPRRAVELVVRFCVVLLIHKWPTMFERAGKDPWPMVTLVGVTAGVVFWNILVWPARKESWARRRINLDREPWRRIVWDGLDVGYLMIASYLCVINIWLSPLMKSNDFAMLVGWAPLLFGVGFLLTCVLRGKEYVRILIHERTL